jgi:hypothetical protein
MAPPSGCVAIPPDACRHLLVDLIEGDNFWIDYLQGLAILNNCMADDKSALQAGTHHMLRSKKLLQEALAVCR